ncbi:MAG: ChbG/HpnK family deacetylase [bacterium]|nr:ChbG/HpnK family deacetylase [Candidatus Colisoma equi]
MTVIINADDFGFDENRTRAILSAFKQGIVTRTTAMANMPYFEQAMKMAKEEGLIEKVGLHFNLAEGHPLTDELCACHIICDENGELMTGWHCNLKTRLILPRSAKRAIAAEARAQMQRFLDCGGRLMHFDSHYHVHTDFSVASAMFPVARQFGFRTTRLSRTLAVEGGAAKQLYKVLFNRYAKMAIGVDADEFTDFEGFAQAHKGLPESARVEVMVHPQYDEKGEMVDMGRPMKGDAEFWSRMEIRKC